MNLEAQVQASTHRSANLGPYYARIILYLNKLLLKEVPTNDSLAARWLEFCNKTLALSGSKAQNMLSLAPPPLDFLDLSSLVIPSEVAIEIVESPSIQRKPPPAVVDNPFSRGVMMSSV